MFKKLKYFYSLLIEDQIIVYQMGKVGSSSIYKSLKSNGFNVIHAHNFDDCDVYKFYKNTDGFGCFYPLSQRIRRFLSSKLKLYLLRFNKNVKIITCVRDIEKVIISRYIQDLHLRMVSYHKKQIVYKEMTTMVDEVLENIEQDINLDYFLSWFDVELKKNFGLDVYSVEYDRNTGIGIASQFSKPLLVVNMSKVNGNILSSELSKFIDSNSEIEIRNSNVSKEKWYSEIQSMVRKKYAFSSSYKKKIEESKMYKFFDL